MCSLLLHFIYYNYRLKHEQATVCAKEVRPWEVSKVLLNRLRKCDYEMIIKRKERKEAISLQDVGKGQLSLSFSVSSCIYGNVFNRDMPGQVK